MHTPEAVWREAERALREAEHILAITHVAPDGDAVGSLLGFTHALRSLGKHVVPTCQDVPHARFGFLAGLNDIRQSAEGEFDLVVALDASDRTRLGAVFSPERHAHLPMLVIDHHITNLQFGTLNIVEPHVSSTAELVLKLIKQMGLPLTPQIANALLTGVITDTQAFRTTNTTPASLAAAMELMQHGGNLQEVTRQALLLRPFEHLRLLGAGLVNTKLEGRVAYATIPQKLRKELGVHEERGDGGLAGTLMTAQEVDVAAVFVELVSGDVEVSLRGQPGFDVSQLALELGGGGHPAAAGCTLPGPLKDAVNHVLPRLRQLVREA
ncbi:MAG: DHH family phosphoesterase [Anaerolineae bacterium]|nr:DHH family phosphoesterase [Thermoflexales bacterium]MDW8396361.1 DHH family phosphoesterase [Anaerolineae bacterium]